MQIWVPGARGMLGRELCDRLQARGLPYRGTEVGEVDITDEDAVRAFWEREQPTVVINAAAYTAVDKAEEAAEAAEAVNARGPGNLAAAAAASGASLLHVSTDYVFDGQGSRPYREDDPCSPLGVYGKTKRQGEEAALKAHPDGTLIVRTSWLFGAQGKSFVHTMLRVMRERDHLRVVDDQRGRPTAASDLADALLQLAGLKGERPAPPLATGVVHFANRGETSWHGFATAILEEAKAQGVELACQQIEPIPTSAWPTPAARPAYSVLDTRRFSELTRSEPRAYTEPLREVIRALL